MQWAAINNRCSIATYLIEKGAAVNASGGVLGESALQWAVRKGKCFYPFLFSISFSAHCLGLYRMASVLLLHQVHKCLQDI